ncbi:PE-PPE domain-containing protein [Nocardia sp. NBC_01327]|uniref:PE-PPE domain-containing protein n=1 Tax=Nocardia sp. NBC_01327 TaxID=2903593 RepID=UPI002E15FABA|nr:PE-PPE domain-containing protein [Nocardia sp. NBC_01327]
MPVDVVTCRGTGEPFQGATNMLAHVTALLDTTKFRIVGDVSYPATVGAAGAAWNICGASEDESVREGIINLANLIRSTPNTVGVLGYSLGALVVSGFLEAKARGEYADCEVAWVGTVANPARAQDSSIDPQPFGFGVAGQHGPWPAIPVWEAANPADVITSCPSDSPLRTFADGISAFSLADTGGWTTDLIDRVRTHRWQPDDLGSLLHPVATWRLWSTAAAAMEGYTVGGAHTTAYIAGGYLDRLASAINAA